MIIPGYSRYDITEDGVVTDIIKNRVLKAHIARTKGYAYKNVVVVDDNGCKKATSVLRLLAIAYLPKPDCVCVARAKDCDNTNTMLSNVEWVPCNERVQQTWKQGKMSTRKRKGRCYGESSIALVYDTLKTLGEPTSVAELSRLLDIQYSTVRYSVYELIKRGRVQRTNEGVEVLE